MCHPASPRRRAGFTLVEALVVTAILAILFGLVSSAVIRGLHTAEDARVQAEIKQLELAITAFQTSFKVDYIPSSIVLRTRLAAYPSNDPDWQYLSTLWPQLSNDPAKQQFVDWGQVVNSTAIGAARPNPPAADYVLEGDQCLAFFLGGRRFDNQQAQTLGGYIGFSSNPTRPMDPPPPAPATAVAVGPFFDFDPERVRDAQNQCRRVSPTPAARSQFPSFRDAYGTGHPYVYFSAYRGNYTKPGLTTVDQVRLPDINPAIYTANKNGINRNGYISAYRDVSSPPTAQPQNGQFLSRNRFQIMSAGRDGLMAHHQASPVPFATEWRNATYSGANAAIMVVNPREAQDDLGNFHPNKLGIPK